MPGTHDNDVPRRSFAREWSKALEASKDASKARRDRVLAHPDLARRLTERPFAIGDPQRWNGWIPPRTVAADTCPGCNSARDSRQRPSCEGRPHAARINDSPIRRQLVEIAAEALRREEGEQQPLELEG